MKERSTLRSNSSCFYVLYYLILLFCFCFYFLRWIVFQMCNGINGIVTCRPIMLLLVPSVWWVVLWCCRLQPRLPHRDKHLQQSGVKSISAISFVFLLSLPFTHFWVEIEAGFAFPVQCDTYLQWHWLSLTLTDTNTHSVVCLCQWEKHGTNKKTSRKYFYLCYSFFFLKQFEIVPLVRAGKYNAWCH